MPIIGKPLQTGGYHVLDALSASSTNSYTMQLGSANFTPESANHLIVSLNGVIQKPGSAFSVSGSTLTFIPSSGTLSSSDSIDFIIALGRTMDIGTPSDGVITNAKLAQDIISGETALAAIPATTDEFLISDAGTLKRIDAQFFQNTPAFQATVNAAQTLSTGTATKMEFNTENFDSDGKYDPSTNYRFTPTIAGKYLIHARIGYADEAVEDKSQETRIFKNGSLLFQANRRTAASTGRDATVACVAIVDLDADDYVEVYGYHNSGSNADTLNSTTSCIFEGYKLIGI